MEEQDVKQLKKSVNYRFSVATVEALAGLVKRWSCKPTAAVERAILEASMPPGKEEEKGDAGLQGEAGTITRWWMRQDGVGEQEIIGAALLVYDEYRQSGAFPKVPSAVGRDSVSIAARAAAAARAAQMLDEPEVSDPAAIPGVQVGAPVEKSATCGHCGEKFAGPKKATLCHGCKDGGHSGDVRECPVCWHPA